jgi:hypothetical protein
MLIYPDTFTDDARTILLHARAHAGRLGHAHNGGEHFLLALAAAGLPVSAVLRENGVTAEGVEEEIVRLEGLGPAAGLFASLDTGALAAVGVDSGAMRDRIEASFGPDALAQARQATQVKPRRPSGLPVGPVGRWRIRRHVRHMAPPAPVPPAPPGLYQAVGPRPAGHAPTDPDAWDAVSQSIHEMMIRHHARVQAEHVALAFTAMTTGLVPTILSALGTSAPALRAAIVERGWPAG